MGKFLNGKRFNQHSNHHIIMMQEQFNSIDFGSTKWIDQLQKYVNRHKQQQVPRLQELKRYYMADNNIKYRAAKKDEYAADNRIASDFARYITIFEQGYMLGQPIQYKNEDSTMQRLINEFVSQNNEEYHNVLMKTDLSIYGRAYELLTVEKRDKHSSAQVKLYKMDPQQTFVIYDDTYERNSLMGVNYYTVNYDDSHRKDIMKVYTSNCVYTYEQDNINDVAWRHTHAQEHFLNGVPVNEFSNNEDRTGAFEPVLDNIDAYDLSQSELANFQQNSNDAILVISGNTYTGVEEQDYLDDGRLNPNGRLAVSKAFKEAQILIMDDNPNLEGAKPSAYYLVKTYDSTGAEEYKKRIVSDILRFTFTPDSNDSNFGGQQTGEAMKYKLMASDNLRAKQERLFKKCIMRRLRLAVNVWKIKGNDSVAYDTINNTAIVFTPNIPRNDAELIVNARQLFGMVSEQTVFEILSQVTGIDATEELARLVKTVEETATAGRRAGEANDEKEV